ncbi:MAG: hypothetical protein AAF639_05295 [Chloroflexota bacterium]
MSSSQTNSDNILVAFFYLLPQLPDLVGEPESLRLNERILAKLEALEQCQDTNQKRRLSLELIKIVAPYEAARERLQTELHLVGMPNKIRSRLAQSAYQLNVPATQTELSLQIALQTMSVTDIDPDEDTFRTIEIDKGGADGGTLVRYKNITLDYKRLLMFGAGAAINLAQPHPILLMLGILLAALELQNLAEVSINEQEASVFWGLLHTCGRPNHPAKEHDIVARIHQERATYGMDALTDKEIQTSLALLNRLGVITRVEGRYPMWQFVEECRIRG